MASAARSKFSQHVSWCSKYIRLNVPNLAPHEVTLSNIYLRDNSHSPSSLNPRSQQRLHLIKNIDLDVRPLSAEIEADRNWHQKLLPTIIKLFLFFDNYSI